MESTLSQPILVSRPTWVRASDRLSSALHAFGAALAYQLARWREERQHARDRDALRHLSPWILRDIGAPEDIVVASMYLRRSQAALRLDLFGGC